MKVSASFAVIIMGDKVCATTRDDGTIGLPGGKKDHNETPIETALRESEEEGWNVSLYPGKEPIPFLTSVVNERLVTWVLIQGEATPKKEYAEKERGILPILVSIDEIKNSSRGNDIAIPIAIELLNHLNAKKIDLRDCKPGDKLLTKHGRILTYVKPLDSNDYMDHEIRYPNGGYGSRTHEGFVYRRKRLDTDEDIVEIIRS
jgi:hypothetical protein